MKPNSPDKSPLIPLAQTAKSYEQETTEGISTPRPPTPADQPPRHEVRKPQLTQADRSKRIKKNNGQTLTNDEQAVVMAALTSERGNVEKAQRLLERMNIHVTGATLRKYKAGSIDGSTAASVQRSYHSKRKEIAGIYQRFTEETLLPAVKRKLEGPEDGYTLRELGVILGIITDKMLLLTEVDTEYEATVNTLTAERVTSI